MDLRPSQVDSARFGLRIGRVTLEDDDTTTAARLPAAFVASDLDVLVVRYPAAAVGHCARLLHPDVEVIHADTLLYFGGEADVVGTEGSPLALADDATVDAHLADAVRSIFAGYRNHYAANPRVDASRVAEGYVEWAEGHRGTPSEHVTALAVPEDGSLAAVAAYTTTPSELSIGLAGVAPHHRRRGVYQRLLDAVCTEGRARGIDRVVISTQSHNLGPQRAWARRGWLPEGAVQTVHLNRR
jgi:ribosomal protein S18 acetylase RimI-like enzyme